MLDQELASIIHFVLAAAGNPSPIYRDMPESFHAPAIFFPHPELTASGDTFATYAVEYSWYIKVFHTRDDLAYSMARDVLTAIMAARRLIPLRNIAGAPTGDGFRVHDPEIRTLDTTGVGGAAQLTVSWDSRRPYFATEAEKVMDIHLNINDAYQSAVAGAQTPDTGQNNE